MILLHAAANTASVVFPYWQSDSWRIIGFGVLLIAAGIIVATGRLKKNIYKVNS